MQLRFLAPNKEIRATQLYVAEGQLQTPELKNVPANQNDERYRDA
jgi:hypothetical protein